MAPVIRVLVLAGAFTLGAAPLRGQAMSKFSGGLTLNTPIGQFDSLATTGWGLSIRNIIGDEDQRWSGRLALGFDYFKGKGRYSAIQFVGAGADLVHRSTSTFYQFVGITQAQARFTGVASASGTSSIEESGNFGFTGGVGVKYEVNRIRLYTEFGATYVLTPGKSSSWFPIRAGVRF